MDANTVTISENRIVFLDRLRVVLVLLVVLMHVAVAYTNLPVLTVQDPQKNIVLDIFLLLMDGCLMSLLFFIAGYFACPSLKTRTRGDFIISKMRRIGLPFVAIALFLAPYITYVGVRTHFPEPPGFFRFWLSQMKTAVNPHPVLIADVETATKHWMDYSPWHLWFIFLLLIFYLLYAGYDFLSERSGAAGWFGKSEKISGVLTSLVIAGATITVLYTAVSFFSAEWVWSQTSIIHFQPVRIPLYGVIFALGIYANSDNWFIDKNFPGKMWIWGAASIFFSIALIPSMYHALMAWGKIMPWKFSLLHGFIRTGIVFSTLGFLVKFFIKYSDRKSVLDRISDVSYEIYIIHLPVVVAVAKVFTIVAIPALLKFICAGIIVTGLSWGTGRYLIKPYPKITCAVMMCVFILLCVIYR